MYFKKNPKELKLIGFFVLFCLLGVYLNIPYRKFSYRWEADTNDFPQDEKIESMDTVHIALSVTGNQALARGITMLKSMLYYANRFKSNVNWCSEFVEPSSSNTCPFSTELSKTFPIHVHFVSNDETIRLINSTLSKWTLDKFKWSVYRNEPHLNKIRWIPNGHGSGIYALIKLILPDIIPKEIKRVIFLDTDVMFNYNIWNLWELFKNFNRTQALGIVWEHDRDRKLCLSKRPHTIRFMGVNSGVMLLHLERLRNHNWNILLHNELFFNLDQMRALYLGEQNIYNSIIWHNPSIYYRVPCEWNFQLYPYASLYCCPVVWNLRRPDEIDCISQSNSPGSVAQPNLVKLVHYNYGPKPESDNAQHVSDMQDKRIPPKLTHESMTKRFFQVYYQFSAIPEKCFQ